MNHADDAKSIIAKVHSEAFNDGGDRLANLVRAVSELHQSEMDLAMRDIQLIPDLDDCEASRENPLPIDPSLLPALPSDKAGALIRQALGPSYSLQEVEPWSWRWVPYPGKHSVDELEGSDSAQEMEE